ncbi:MAG: hypothetical protein J5673_06060 [Candidatus Methanomethylophilaceae archaeon]|nr:hypothetical protein [Candidatus Methanomethylophilaceae archaeon]
MSIVQKAIDYIRTVNGVLDAYEMDDEVSNAVSDVEKSVRTRTNHDYKNVGYDFAMERKHRICVFYDDTYIFGVRSVLKLMTSDGTIMGTNLTPDEIPEYRKRDDVLFVSEDFVVFTNIIGKGEEVFVLYPFEIHEIEENVPGTKNVIGSSPTTSSDDVLKQRFGKPAVKGMYTMIIAFDD